MSAKVYPSSEIYELLLSKSQSYAELSATEQEQLSGIWSELHDNSSISVPEALLDKVKRLPSSPSAVPDIEAWSQEYETPWRVYIGYTGSTISLKSYAMIADAARSEPAAVARAKESDAPIGKEA